VDEAAEPVAASDLANGRSVSPMVQFRRPEFEQARCDRSPRPSGGA